MKISSFFFPAAPTIFTTIKKERSHSNSCERSANTATSQGKANTGSCEIQTKHIGLEKGEPTHQPVSLLSVKDSQGFDDVKPKESDLVLQKVLPSENGVDSLDSSEDSDPEVIESTPEVKKYDKADILSISKITQSPDFIPPTPQPQPKKRIYNFSSGLDSAVNNDKRTSSTSVLSNKAQSFLESNVTSCRPLSLKSKANRSTLSKQEQNSKISFSDLQDIHVNMNSEHHSMSKPLTSTKRHAVTGTGVSPDPKRVSTPDNKDIEIEIESCKSNLLERFVAGASLLSDRESDGSFSLLQPNCRVEEKEKIMKKEICKESLEEWQHVEREMLKTKSYENTDLFHSIGKVALKERILSSQSRENEVDTESWLDDGNIKTRKHNQKERNLSGSLEEDDFPLQEHFVSSQGFGNTVDSLDHDLEEEKIFCTLDMKDVFDETHSDLMDDDLAASFEVMSPFKEEVNRPKKSFVGNKQVKQLLNEGVGSESFSVQGRFGRHVVTAVERDAYKGEIFLRLVSAENDSVRTCTLSGTWSQSMVSEGDIVHILYTDPVDGHFLIDNSKGVIVINPDFLISGTSVVSAVFCRRKTILSERFKGLDSGNQLMLIGSLVHQLFQEVVKKKVQTFNELDNLVRELIAQPKVVRDMYGFGISEAHIFEEMNNFIPHIHAWTQRYLGSGLIQSGKDQGKEKQRNQWKGKIADIQDIEENIWSPKLGLKGKIDLTVKTYQHGASKVVPLELKTGQPSFSAEHRGQVTLYSMMSADRRQDPKSGLLLYLKNGAMEEIPAGDKEKQGLIQLRNDIIYHLAMKPTPQEGNLLPMIPILPEPLDFERACTKCAYLLMCSVFQKSIEESVGDPPHAMAILVPKTTEHLSKTHLNYFRHWCLLLHLEIADGKRDAALRALWCQDAIKREASGDCLSWLMLEKAVPVTELEPGQFMHVFTRSQSQPCHTKLASVGLQAGDNVVVSSKTELALSLGAVMAFGEDSVKVVLDRDLKLCPYWHDRIFHVDRCEYQNTMSINFTNLAKLQMDTPRATSLRFLVVDRNPPSFKKGLSPDIVSKGKHILKCLNKMQQRAVLKTLMAQSYSLVKGFPGTGKTSTIVAMVRLMVTLGYSVLVTSYTHSAVDNILLKLKKHDIDFLRLGRISRIHSDLLSYADEKITSRFRDVLSLSKFYDSKPVVATTCLGVNHVLFTKRNFDFCIIDEASQVLQVAALGPLFHASCFVLVGDPKQLPPVIQSKQAKNLGMSESLFMRLDSPEATSCLTEQYRMNGPIMKIANNLMYENQLQCANPDLETAILHLPNYKSMVCHGSLSVWLQKILEPSLENSVVFLDTCGAAIESRDGANLLINQRETELVVAILLALIKLGVTLDEVGVIAPYRAQVKLVCDRVRKEVPMGQKLEVNTVDQYQGRDKNIIVYCCVRSGIAESDVNEILQDERRLNVAITRAKYKLIMIGDTATLKLYTPFRKLTTHLEPHQIYHLQDGQDEFVWQVGVKT
ncbi:DNA replication ATP-dependent helicase/nuclease DNA2 isoform X2 [Panulirus ornatus]